MARSIIAKETLEVLEQNAPTGYDVKEKLFDIEIYNDEVADKDELFETLYLSKKADNPEYLQKLVGAMSKYTAEDLAVEGQEPVTVQEKLIDEHKKAAMVVLSGARAFVHYK